MLRHKQIKEYNIIGTVVLNVKKIAFSLEFVVYIVFHKQQSYSYFVNKFQFQFEKHLTSIIFHAVRTLLKSNHSILILD
jgi:hypothetical protein